MRRLLLMAIAVVAILLAGSSATIAAPAEHQVVVCKYVGTPGADERLQTGENPIVVDDHSLTGKGFDGTFPFSFSDAQGRSIAVRWAANAHDGDLSDCPGYQPPPSQEVTPSPSPSPSPSLTYEPSIEPSPTASPSPSTGSSPVPSPSAATPAPSTRPSIPTTPSVAPSAPPVTRPSVTLPPTDTASATSAAGSGLVTDLIWFGAGLFLSMALTFAVLAACGRRR